MRLSKKIAAVALAAVMAVSMLTACGSTGGPSSSGPSSSGPSSSGPETSGPSSGSPETSGPSSGSPETSSPGTGSEGKNETIAYEKSRTAKFYQKLGTGNYTMNETVQIEMIEQGKMTMDALVSTDGKRAYAKQTLRMAGIKNQTQIALADLTTKKGWILVNYPEPDPDGKLGYYTVETVKGDLQEAVSPVNPIEGREFKQECKDNDYTETQTMKYSGLTDVYSFVYKGNSSVPEYAELKEYNVDGVETIKVRVEYSNFKPQVVAEYLDFETILANYNEKTGTSTTQAQEPSIASLILG